MIHIIDSEKEIVCFYNAVGSSKAVPQIRRGNKDK